MSVTNHVRRQIREKIASVLSSGGYSFATRVYIYRTQRLADSDLPAVLVSFNSENLDEDSIVVDGTVRAFVATFRLSLVAIETTSATVDDILDQMSAEVAVALYADQTLGGLCETLDIVSTRLAELEKASFDVASLDALVAVQYQIDMADPSTVAD